MHNEVFDIDTERFCVLDLSYEVVPWKDVIGDRPFLTELSPTLPDGKDKEVVFTHTHVGTHIEAPRHFLGLEGKAVSDFPFSAFMGRGVLLPIKLPAGTFRISAEYVDELAEGLVHEGDILIFRNETMKGDDTTSVFELHKEGNFPYLDPSVGDWLVEKHPKMIVFGAVLMGKDIPAGLSLEEKLHKHEILILEYPGDLHQITKRVVFFMALPFRVKDVGSIWTRAICIEAR